MIKLSLKDFIEFNLPEMMVKNLLRGSAINADLNFGSISNFC